MKLKNAFELQQINAANIFVPPHSVSRFMGGQVREVSVAGSDISIGEDYGTVEEVRAALEWYVEQLGGKVKWTKGAVSENP